MKRKIYDDPPKRCKKCRKLLRSHNKSMLCGFHLRQEYYRLDKQKEYRKKYYQEHKKSK